METSDTFLAGVMVGMLLSVLLLMPLGVVLWFIRPWLRMFFSGGRGPFLYTLGMRFRGSPSLVIDAYVSLLHAGETVSLQEVESCYLAHRANIIDASELMTRVREGKRESAGRD